LQRPSATLSLYPGKGFGTQYPASITIRKMITIGQEA
jgi:hypothetical protein